MHQILANKLMISQSNFCTFLQQTGIKNDPLVPSNFGTLTTTFDVLQCAVQYMQSASASATASALTSALVFESASQTLYMGYLTAFCLIIAFVCRTNCCTSYASS